jgi:eukaryotic-like serine/threonine-protein kinase
MPAIPERIGKYKVTRALGKGAMGMVYEGFDPVIERRVAIKTILREYLDAAEAADSVARFKREAQAGGRLTHPAIVGVYEYGEDGNGAFIVMEYVEGKELREFFRNSARFDLIDVFEIMKQLLAALDYSHRQGVVHRDIKPANLMILAGNKVKVMDFGIARIDSSSLTQVGMIVGTPTHMAPEQLTGVGTDARADIWSSGVILYELLTGVNPFMAATPAEVMHKVLQVDPDRPSMLQPSLPAAFDTVVLRALAKKAADRFATAREFHGALLQAFQGKAAVAPRGETDAESTLRSATAERAAAAAGISTARLALAPDMLAEVERSLSRSIGPLAKVLIRKAQSEAASPEEFIRLLAEHIDDGEERSGFLAKVAGARKAGAATHPAQSPASPQPGPKARGAPARIPLSPDALAKAEKQLASYVGPLARILIKDAISKSGNLQELYAQLAEHIDSEDERKAFLAAVHAGR